jgi:hypothetical protein
LTKTRQIFIITLLFGQSTVQLDRKGFAMPQIIVISEAPSGLLVVQKVEIEVASFVDVDLDPELAEAIADSLAEGEPDCPDCGFCPLHS